MSRGNIASPLPSVAPSTEVIPGFAERSTLRPVTLLERALFVDLFSLSRLGVNRWARASQAPAAMPTASAHAVHVVSRAR